MEQQRQEGFWSRTSLNLAPNASTTAEPPDREEAIRLIDRHLVSLFNFVRREIAYRQAVGDLVAGDLTAEDVVDEVALGAIEHFDARPQELGFSRWLLQLALDVIERRVREINEECETHVHVEEDMPETPPAEEATQVGDEIFEFYQPDEDIRLEDLIADERVPTPEEALAQREMQQYINRTLARLPRRWREAFVLYSVEGLTLEEVGRVVQRPVEDVRRWIDLTRAFLRQCLVEAGAVPADREAMREEVNVR
jgi:RNA polymerase sigma factor (sigma-70 family)